MIQNRLIKLNLFQYLVIAFKNFYRIPALLFFRHIMYCRFLNMRKRMLHSARKGVHRDSPAILRCINCRLCRLHNSGALQSGNFCHLTSKFTGQFFCIDPVTVLLHHIHHIDCNNNRNTKFGKLRRQIQVSFQICTVDDV